jgi:hypothetical protein
MPAAPNVDDDISISPAPRDGDVDSAALVVPGKDTDAAVSCLRTHGVTVLQACIPPDVVQATSCALQPFLDHLVEHWSAADALTLPSWRAWGVSRTPRVNAGKKNVHFVQDEQLPNGMQSLHAALVALAQAGGFAALLRAYHGHDVVLYETGVSVTRAGGTGMELHADGGEGEATVLLALRDVPREVGALALVPGTHVAYTTHGACVDGEDCDGDVEQQKRRPITWHCYAPGDAVVLDARTLHGASDDVSPRENTGTAGIARAVVWFIYQPGTSED